MSLRSVTRSVLGAWKRSGQGLEAFARNRGLVPQRLYCALTAQMVFDAYQMTDATENKARRLGAEISKPMNSKRDARSPRGAQRCPYRMAQVETGPFEWGRARRGGEKRVVDQATLEYRRCSPPTRGSAITLPAVGGSTSRETGESPPSGHLRLIAVVIGHVLADQTQQMAFSKHDDVIEQGAIRNFSMPR